MYIVCLRSGWPVVWLDHRVFGRDLLVLTRVVLCVCLLAGAAPEQLSSFLVAFGRFWGRG